MSPLAKAGTAFAAVVLIAVVGYTLLPGTSGGVGGPAPTAIPTASPTTAPSPSPSAAASAAAVYPTWYTPEGGSLGAGILSAGSHTSRFTPAFTYTVPTGWVNGRDDGDIHLLFPDTPANQAEHASSGDLAHAIQLGQVDQPYFVCKGLENSGGTAAEMVAAAASNEVLAVSNVVDVTLGSLTGKRFDVRANPGWKGQCPGDPPGLDLTDGRTRAFLLDGPTGVVAIFVGSLHSADHDAFVTQATPIVESFVFTS